MKSPIDLWIHGYRLELTCLACPEQYDVYDPSGRQVGYFRLRHGRFTVEYPDCGGKLLLEANPQGDGLFEDSERLPWLYRGVRAIQKEIANFRFDSLANI